jgi:GNAT superfamily N-acetyltransferase
MDRAHVLARYDAEMRADPPPEPGVEHAWADGVLRTVGVFNHIGWWDPSAKRMVEIVEREAHFFRGRPKGVEWKVFSHDGPPGLEDALADAGWVGEEAETFVCIDIDEGVPPADQVAGLEVREVCDPAGVGDFLIVNAVANGRPARQSVEEVMERLEQPGIAYFVAYAEGRPVCSGGLHLPPARAFAGLYSGGTVPDHRGRGVYRALVAARAAEARRRGFRYLTVDARETSRPILQRLGFEPLATVRGWTLPGVDP